MAKNDDKFKFITPRGVVSYPRLLKPDSGPKGKESKVPQYKVTVTFDPNGTFVVGKKKTPASDVVERLEELRDELYDEVLAEGKSKLKGKKLEEFMKKLEKKDVFAADLDAEGEETGKVQVRAKTASEYTDKKTGETVKRSPPPMFDSKGNPVKKLPNVGGGSEMKVEVLARPYYVESSGAVGISYYLESTQLLKFVEYVGGGSAESRGYDDEDEEEGFRADDYSAGSGDSDGDDSSDDAAPGADF